VNATVKIHSSVRSSGPTRVPTPRTLSIITTATLSRMRAMSTTSNALPAGVSAS